MPRLSEAKKDVLSCDKLRGAAQELRSADFRMGEPIPTIVGISSIEEANPGN